MHPPHPPHDLRPWRQQRESVTNDDDDIYIYTCIYIYIYILLYYRLTEHIDRYMAVVQYIVIALHTQVQLLSSQ